METKKWWLLPTILGGVGLVVLVLFMILLSVNNIQPLAVDIAVRDFFYNIRGEKGGFVYWVFRILTEFGDIIGIVIVVVFLCILTKVDFRVCLLILGGAIAHLVNSGFKDIFDRVRPIAEMQWQHETSMSFPSGHSVNASVMFCILGYIIYRSDLKESIKKVFYVVCPAIILIVMTSRMVLGVHYFSDVCAGASVGFIFAALMIVLYHVCETKNIFTTNLVDFIKSKRNKE